MDDEDFGTERLEQLLRENHETPLADLLIRMHDEVKLFSGRGDADDDITLIAMRIVGDNTGPGGDDS
jgi:serine phosphatase RsbU (regulator of sigma subunit)